MNQHRGFTLIEILICCILLGIGVTSVIGLLLVSLQRSREVTAMSTMGPVATAAASLVIAFNQVPPSGSRVIVPDSTDPPSDAIRPLFPFTSPYALAIDRAPDTGDNDPAASDYDPGSPLLDTGSAGTDDAHLITLRVRVYDTPEHRDRGVRSLGTMFVRQYLRPRP